MALGAQREQVVRLMLGDGLRPALYGLVLGLAASVGAVRLIQSMLYGTRPLDPAIFAAVAATLLVVAAWPAWFRRGGHRGSIRCRHCEANS